MTNQTELTTFAPDSTPAQLAKALRDDGACIVRDLVPEALLRRLNSELEPWIERSQNGRDNFTGRHTKRTGALVARSPASREAVLQPLVLAAANEFLGPYCEKIQLHLTQTIHIMPGQEAQLLHRDRLAWGGYLPKPIEPQFNTIWALTDFTEENGATHIVPGSQNWPLEQNAGPQESVQAVMQAGSVLMYSGTVIHGGGGNRSHAPRTGMNITYCLGWLRQEENQFLSCPPRVARELEPELTELLGYSMGNYALGYYSEPEMIEEYPDTLPPEMALGRKAVPSKANAFVGEPSAQQAAVIAASDAPDAPV